MDKFDVIKTLTENGIFELTHEILDIISADKDPAHSEANRHIQYLIYSVDRMKNWSNFDWKAMIDFVTQAYGFTKWSAYCDLRIYADVIDQIEELHDILWVNLENMNIRIG